ncbi:uncharacterized protein [Dysidea avara]|uniref:uncharacterized protein n=1 Tax=Dysidea avara TaxID=196820 RepID=UPI00331AF223
MGFIVLAILVVVTTSTDAKPMIKDEPTCVKIDECSCNLTGVEQPGVIDLHSLVSGEHEPTFMVEAKSEQTNLFYNYSYNPCMNFSDYGCPNTSICQTGDGYHPYDLGNVESVKFLYLDEGTVGAYYESKFNDRFGYNRTSVVELICDETEVEGKFEYVGEPAQRIYTFKLYTRCACPGKCVSSETECKANDLCSCEMSDGTGTINLHSLDNPTSPLRDEASPTNAFLYNPCSPMTNPHCYNSSLCEEQGDSLLPLGLASSAKFVSNNNRLGIQYTGFNNTVSTVNLICQPNQRDEPFFRAEGDGRTFNLYSVCACPNGCGAPPSNGTCDQTDSCTCKSPSDGAVINLHNLDNPYAPLTAEDNEGYTYYYNPCSGIKLQNPIGKCDGVAACQEDPFHNTWYNIGNNGPKIDYNTTSESFIFHYTEGEGGRSFDVRMICDRDSKAPVLAADGDIPKGVTRYPLKLISKYACGEQILD